MAAVPLSIPPREHRAADLPPFSLLLRRPIAMEPPATTAAPAVGLLHLPEARRGPPGMERRALCVAPRPHGRPWASTSSPGRPSEGSERGVEGMLSRGHHGPRAPRAREVEGAGAAPRDAVGLELTLAGAGQPSHRSSPAASLAGGRHTREEKERQGQAESFYPPSCPRFNVACSAGVPHRQRW
jgi:hypothetical protein